MPPPESRPPRREVLGDLDRRGGGALRRPDLQQVQPARFDGELEVDRVAIELLGCARP